MRLNAFSLLIMSKINNYVGLFLMYSPFIVFPLFIYLAIRKKYSSTQRKSLILAVIIALPFALINWYAWIWVVADIYFQSPYSYLINQLLIAVAVSIICAVILKWILKNKSSDFKVLVKYFIKGFLLIASLYILLNFGWLWLREMLLKRDPAYVEMLEKFKIRREAQERERANSQNG